MFSTYLNGKYTNIYNAKEASEHVSNTITYYEELVAELRKRNKELYEHAEEIVRKDYEHKINSLEERLRFSYGEFATETELNEYNNFVEEHMHDRETSRYNGGRAPYLIPHYGGVGRTLKVVCPICGESKDITDDTVW